MVLELDTFPLYSMPKDFNKLQCNFVRLNQTFPMINKENAHCLIEKTTILSILFLHVIKYVKLIAKIIAMKKQKIM
ncbi:MAG TPA: hypothetical protein DEB62_13835 [Vibrio sp.]|uniref:Uncharacterized protein n=1 Tax=Vibrio casei TaxID=673372 RepID=A0A368LH86_9VIBR|nr:hypothetical protein CIK83_11670 [Vibrio casei]HBV77439.1 hypothetical protein [Vibrio sp.]